MGIVLNGDATRRAFGVRHAVRRNLEAALMTASRARASSTADRRVAAGDARCRGVRLAHTADRASVRRRYRARPAGRRGGVWRAGHDAACRPSCEKYYWLGTHEERVQDVLAEHVRPGSVVYDIGAHAGFFTLLCSRLAGAEGRVYAFEPRRENIERLRRNIDANDAANVRIVPAAASDRTGEAAFVMHASTLEGSLAVSGQPAAARVRTETVDALVRGGMAPPDFIKIDVEGAEGAVIRGAVRTIDAQRPLLLIEVHSAEAGREVAAAMPCRYTYRDIETGIEAGEPLTPSHYLVRPVVGPERTPPCA
jgi:FkbM family methyltransferase